MIFLSSNIVFADSADSDKTTKIKTKDEKLGDLFKDNAFFVKQAPHSGKIDKKIIKAFEKKIKSPKFMPLEFDIQNRTTVYINLDKPESISTIPSDVQITGVTNNTIVAKLTLNQMDQLGNLTSVLSITPQQRAVFFAPTSEGVAFSNANALHDMGILGIGTTVAIIDDSFFVTDPQIQPNIISSTLFDSGGYCGGSLSCGMTAGHSHGTAVSETVVDMAPAVNLRLYVIGNSVDFANAVDDAIANGADIITASLGFPSMGGDGTTKSFRDGTSYVAKKVNDAYSSGVFVTISAGNDGSSHWSGIYTPSTVAPSTIGLNGYQSVMEFQSSASGKQRACLPVTDIGGYFIATWNDWATSSQDYDLLLFNSAMTQILTGSAGYQTGSESPLEAFDGANVSSACLVIASWSSTQNHKFDIYTDGNTLNPTFQVRAKSIGTPADSIGAMAIGAIRYSTDTLESFSSSGPTDDGRNKPEICGPDGTSTHQSDYLNPFYGTSASAPHVAGAAALLLSENPTLTNLQLKNKMMMDARFNAAYSVDNLCGAGSGALFLIPPPSICGISFVSGAPINYGSIKPGLTSTEQILVLNNTGSAPATLYVSATDWKDSSLVSQMDASQTRFSIGAEAYLSKTPLTTGQQTMITSFNPTSTLNTYWQVLVNLINPNFVGSISQTVNFTATC